MKLFLVLFFISLSDFISGQSITGKVIVGSTEKSGSFVSIQLLDHFNKQIVDKTYTDSEGNFKFEKVRVLSLDLKLTSIEYGDTLFQNIFFSDDTTLLLDIYKPCKYDQSGKNKGCPACHKKDQVIPILYGLIVPPQGKEKKFWSRVDVEFKLGGCSITRCDPHWYCKRDKINF